MESSTETKGNTDFSQSYIKAEHWKSDCEFYRDELNFLSSLINKYFIFLINGDELSKIQDLAVRITRTKQREEDLVKDIIDFMTGIKTNMTEVNKVYFKEINEAEANLEEQMNDFIHVFKELKSDVFQITEKMLENDKVKRLIGA